MPGVATILRLAALGLLLAFLLMPQSFAPLFAPLTQYGAPPIYDQGNLLTLALAHLGTVCCAAAASTLVAVGLGISGDAPRRRAVPAAVAHARQHRSDLPAGGGARSHGCRWSGSARSRR